MPLILVGCAKAKLRMARPASELYISPLFRASWNWAENTGQESRILSAKYGLLAAKDIVDPYDVYLGDLSHGEKDSLAKRIRIQLRGLDLEDIVVLGGNDYVSLVRNALPKMRIHDPLQGLNIGNRIRWLKSSTNSRWRDYVVLEDFYAILRKKTGGSIRPQSLPTLAEFLKLQMPDRGVYFFFESSETRRGRPDLRVTRVGTHAVSQGAKSTLRTRLRTHAGTENLTGSHRSSIFRLHVGTALLARSGDSLMTWGRDSGRVADLPTRESEAGLEILVSKEIREMRVLVLDVSDMSSARSDRAFIERNSIGLLSTVGHDIDPPSSAWLGNSSPRAEIRDSGLWNLDHRLHSINPHFLDVVSQWIESPGGLNPVTPESWWNPNVTLFE